jgi:hypothetical protein
MTRSATGQKTLHELIRGVFCSIRIPYSKLTEQQTLGSNTRELKHYSELNPKYLLPRMISFKNHFLFFLQLILEPFVTKLGVYIQQQQIKYIRRFSQSLEVHG